VTGAFQLLVLDDSIFATLPPKVFVVTAHLLGLGVIPHAGVTVGKSHLYQTSLSVACQNLLLLVLIAREQRPPSSPRFVADVLSIPIGDPTIFVPESHWDIGIKAISN
jgi:hypothetical protein